MNDDFRLEAAEEGAAGGVAGVRRAGARRRKAQTMRDYISLYLRQNKRHADGTPGSYYMRLAVIERDCLCARKVGFGLGTCRRAVAVQRAAVVIRALHAVLRLRLADAVLVAWAGTDLPLMCRLGDIPLPGGRGKRKMR